MTTQVQVQPTFAELVSEMERKGIHVSAASYEDARCIYVFSVEAIPGTFGHPKHTTHLNKKTGEVTRY